jgi:hypothetical protein
MANSPLLPAQGTRVTFRGATLGRVLGVDGDAKAPPRILHPLSADCVDDAGRYVPVLEAGLLEQGVDLQVLAASVDFSLVGSRGELVVAGKGWNLTVPVAYLESAKVSAKVGDFVRVSFAFKRSNN